MIELKPSLELDTLIATKVMGFPSIYEPNITQEEYEKRRNATHPRYSWDIAAAWEVVEKIKFMQPNWQAFGLEPNHLQFFTIEYQGLNWIAGWAPPLKY